MNLPNTRQGKLAVCLFFLKDRIERVKANCQFCPTLAPPFSLFLGVATRHVELFKKGMESSL
jgi:hypothetical protein